MTVPTATTAARLAADLVARWVATGGPPLVPPERRDELAATLNRCMASDAVRTAYVTALEVGWNAHFRQPPMATYPSADIPEELITRGGFGSLDDVTLGDLAVRPEAIVGMHMALTIPPADDEDYFEAGDWFFDELDAVGSSDASSAPLSLPPTPHASQQPPQPSPAGRSESVSPPPPVSPAVRRQAKRLSLVPWSVAAAALVCLGLLWVSTRKGVDGGAPETLLARSTPTRVQPKGGTPSAVFDLQVQAEREGFVTVVLLPVGGNPEVFPDYGQEEPRVRPEQVTVTGPFEAPVNSGVITVVTATPATDVVRQVVLKLPPNQTSSDQVRDLIRDKLFATGHRWAAFGITTVPRP